MKALIGWLGAAALLALAGQKAGHPDQGQAIFEQQCSTCHHATSAEKKLGPGLKGLFKKRRLQNGQRVTEQSVRAKVEAGGGGMPAYKEMLADSEKAELLAYLKTL